MAWQIVLLIAIVVVQVVPYWMLWRRFKRMRCFLLQLANTILAQGKYIIKAEEEKDQLMNQKASNN